MKKNNKFLFQKKYFLFLFYFLFLHFLNVSDT
jgi:hypothetical protein